MKATVSERVMRPARVTVVKVQPWDAISEYAEYSCGHANLVPLGWSVMGNLADCRRHFEWIEVSQNLPNS